MLLATAKIKWWDLDNLNAVSLTRQPSCVMETCLALGSRAEIEPHTEGGHRPLLQADIANTLPFAIRKTQDMQIGISRIRRTTPTKNWNPQPKCHSEAKSSQKNVNLSVIFSFYNTKEVNMQIWNYFPFSHFCIWQTISSKVIYSAFKSYILEF